MTSNKWVNGWQPTVQKELYRTLFIITLLVIVEIFTCFTCSLSLVSWVSPFFLGYRHLYPVTQVGEVTVYLRLIFTQQFNSLQNVSRYDMTYEHFNLTICKNLQRNVHVP